MGIHKTDVYSNNWYIACKIVDIQYFENGWVYLNTEHWTYTYSWGWICTLRCENINILFAALFVCCLRGCCFRQMQLKSEITLILGELSNFEPMNFKPITWKLLIFSQSLYNCTKYVFDELYPVSGMPFVGSPTVYTVHCIRWYD